MIWLLLGCRHALQSDANTADAPHRWDALLQDAVTAEGLVDYDLLEARRDDLDGYVAWLARPAFFGGRIKADRHAAWINAYNALTMFAILEYGRPASVMDVDGVLPLPGSGFFLETAFEVGGEWVSLSDIEHARLRLKELDVRDHAALNCASRSCPPLRAGLYHAATLPRELDEAMARWVADDARGVHLTPDRAVFSPIFDWYARDFEFFGHQRTLCAIAADHATGDRKARLLALDRQACPHRFADYDWSLNDAP